MTTGRQALHRIDASIAEARRALSTASNDAAGDSRALASIEQRQVDLLQGVAEIRADHLARSDSEGGALGAADRIAATLISEHDDFLRAIGEDLAAAANNLERLETERRDAEEVHITAIDAHEKAATATQERLQSDEEYLALADRLDEANSTAARARQKLEIAEADRQEKGAAYESDPLFVYLRDRQFGAKGYKAFPLFALLDNWVAGLIRFRDHKLNYDRLLEIPVRIGEHADRLDAKAAEVAEMLEAFERGALEADGVGRLRNEIETAHDRLEALDVAIVDAEETHIALAKKMKAVAQGDEGPLAKARETLKNAMSGLTIPDLKILAAETETLEDDRMVDALVRARREKMELEESRRSQASSLSRQERVLAELEDIRRRFKSARFDSPYSQFSGNNLIGALITEFLRGALSRDDLWRRIERGHRTRRRDWTNDMGGDVWTDGFGLPKNWGGPGDFGGWTGGRSWPGGSWGGGRTGGGRIRTPRRPRRIPRPSRMPRSRGGGGFRTGGGF